MKYSEMLQEPKRFQRLTGYSLEMYQLLLPLFESELDNYLRHKKFNGKIRQRAYSSRDSSSLPTVGDKLFFLLIYMKNNPLQVYHAAAFGISESMCNKLIHTYLPLLSQALKHFSPERRADRLDTVLSEDQVYLVDGTERRVQRDTYEQETYYSGKKSTYYKEYPDNQHDRLDYVSF